MCATAINTRLRNVQFERSKACNYSAHIFLPIQFGVCAGIFFYTMLFVLFSLAYIILYALHWFFLSLCVIIFYATYVATTFLSAHAC